MPTYENLKRRGCYLPSICDLCKNSEESSSHLFFNYPFAAFVWIWINMTFSTNLDTSSILHLLKLNQRSWSNQAGNISTKYAHNNIHDFALLHDLHIRINYNPAPKILEVLRQLPPSGRIKLNMDGAAKGNPGHAGGGGIYRDNYGNVRPTLLATM
ncbi:PREDICTED: uncharacterized protein LOC109340812, partial [Lupinus angustifolius]|uniref:uncharacterized protein LOC109340812 n=1 Tax=Lupinus angustifolius TaxID=3871 RepID=UPI00092E77F3